MNKFAIKYQIGIGFIFLFSLLLIMGGSGRYFTSEINKELVTIQAIRIPSIDLLIQADRDMQQAEVALRSLILEKGSSKTFKKLSDDFFKNKKQVDDRMKKFSSIATSKEEIDISASFVKDYNDWKRIGEGLVKSMKSSAVDSRQSVLKSLRGIEMLAFEKARTHLDNLQEIQLQLSAKERADADALSDLALNLNLALIIIALVFGLGLIVYILRNLNRRLISFGSALSDTSGVILQRSQKLADNGRTLESTSTEQASSISQTVASVEEINRMVQRNSENSMRSRELSEQGAKLAGDGSHKIQEMINSIGEISDSNEMILSQVEKGNEEITQIVDVINEIGAKAQVINDIVFQTKLLAFNASVEAARAGEHGKGFAVVAEEVGSLAQMSGSSANEIAELLEDSTLKVSKIIENNKKQISSLLDEAKNKVAHGSEIASACGEILQTLDTTVTTISQSINEITTASQEQSVGINEINTAMNEMDKASQETSRAASLSAENSNALEAQVQNLRDVLLELEVLIGEKLD